MQHALVRRRLHAFVLIAWQIYSVHKATAGVQDDHESLSCIFKSCAHAFSRGVTCSNALLYPDYTHTHTHTHTHTIKLG